MQEIAANGVKTVIFNLASQKPLTKAFTMQSQDNYRTITSHVTESFTP